MKKLVRIVQSPFAPNLEVVDNLVIKLHVPYSEKEVTVQVNPNIQEYQEKADRPGVEVRQLMVTTSTDETQVIRFDLADNKKRVVTLGKETYEIELIEIGRQNMEGQDFLYFEFGVAKT